MSFDTNWIAEAVYEKARRLTMPGRVAELQDAFERAGIVIDRATDKVVTVNGDSCFCALATELKSTHPTAAIAAKAVLHEQNIEI